MNIQDFSVLITVYQKDDAIYFEKALDSVVNQSIRPSEIVIVVDGFVGEDIQGIIDKFLSNNTVCVKVVYLEKNSGLGEACRVGVNNCSYELIARMDSDDISDKYRFEKQLSEFAKDDNVSVVGGQISEFVGEEENIVGYRRVPLNNDEIKKYVKYRCPMNHVTVMMKKSDLLSVGSYESFPYNEDYYLWIKLIDANKKMINIPEILVNVRVGKAMYQRRGGKDYFESELKIQKLLLKKRIINVFWFVLNVSVRFFVQIVFTNSLRQKFFCYFARSQEDAK